MAWGVTSGLSDDDDLFAVRLAGRERYRFRGRVRRMRCRTERFRYRDGGTMKSVKRRLCRTVQGPVQARAGGYAFARRYAIWGRELETLEGLAELAAARRPARGRPSAAQGDLEREHPRRRRPAATSATGIRACTRCATRAGTSACRCPGDGRAEWRGLLPRSRDPHVIDPPGRNWLVNWNNVPAKGWTSGDAPARERLNGPYHRVAMLQELVRQARRRPVVVRRARRSTWCAT